MTTAARPDSILKYAVIQTWTVSAASVATANMPITLTAEKVGRDSTTGENASAIALETQTTAGGKFQVALLSGGAIVPVRVGTAGATAGGYAKVGTTGLIDVTLGGGTTLCHVAGKFNQTGVSADVVGLTVGQFDGVTA